MAINGCLPKDVSLECGLIEMYQGPLFGVEEDAISRAVESRRASFRAGRNCARAALVNLGCSKKVAIPMAKDRQPVWPSGYSGSISHTSNVCAAIVARIENYLSMGLDIESDTLASPDISSIVCRTEEYALGTENYGDNLPGVDLVKLRFVIKEAVFKTYFPVTGYFLDFQDVVVSIDLTGGRFSAKLVNREAPDIVGRRSLTGRFSIAEDHMFALALVAA